MSEAAKNLSRRRNWADVERLVSSGEPETVVLEFKGSLTDDVHEIRRDACAMANAGGGVIVYGIQDAEDRAAGFAPIDSKRVSDRLRETLAKKVEPPLRYETVPLCALDETGREVVVLRVQGHGQIHAVEISPGRLEFWQRRDTSKREMNYGQIKRGLGFDYQDSNDGFFQQQIDALAAWELRSLATRIKFRSPPNLFTEYLNTVESILRKAGNSARATLEAGWLLETTLTDEISRGGLLGNYRLAAGAFINLLPGIASLAKADANANAPASQTFDCVVRFGEMLSYEGNRKLGSDQLLIALGASVMGQALRESFRARALQAQRRALKTLEEQAQHYSGELADCFAWAREDALTLRDNGLVYPSILRRMENATEETLVGPRAS